MLTEIIPLGTASAIPTRDRHLSATALVRGGDMLLFDCGEGTQMRLIHGGLKHSRLRAILITHLHGDHFFGLMGLLSTLALLGRDEPLALIGPEGVAAFVRMLPGLAEAGSTSFPIDHVELSGDFGRAVVLDTPEYFVEARPVEHRIFAVGYRFQEKPRPGRLDATRATELGVSDYRHFRMLKAGQPVTVASGRVVRPEEVVGPERRGIAYAYVTDTRPCEGGLALAAGADLLHHEATFTDEHRDRAFETGHSTAREAAETARDAGATKLLLGHFSARYTDTARLLAEARSVFENTEIARELARYLLDPATTAAGDAQPRRPHADVRQSTTVPQRQGDDARG